MSVLSEGLKHIACVSFGKDSLAMLLLLIEKGEPLDEVVFYDTGMEFNAIYDTRDRILPLLASRGIQYTELRPENPMEYDMFERPVEGKNGKHFGYSWCGTNGCRWGTSMKLAAMDRYCGENTVYIGIAHDERERVKKERSPNKRMPLVEWELTEGECLLICYTRGFYWVENGRPLYALLDRVSCWCCGMKNLKELRNYYHYLPTYWGRLAVLQLKNTRPFKGKGKSVFDLDTRFREEDAIDAPI